MGIIVLSNNGEDNHYNILTKYSKMADRIIIVSPFLAMDMPRMLSGMPTIKYVELYTNLDGYGMAGNVLSTICRLYKYGLDKGVAVSVKYNNRLHGKAYLLYLDLKVKADEYAKKHPVEKIPVFKASDYIKDRMILPDNCRYFLKPLGNAARPVGTGYTIIEDNQIGFSKEPSRISKGDILICHGVKAGNVLGFCKILESEVKKETAFAGDRWNWKLATSCISEKYSSHWWDYDIKTSDLANEYNKIKKKGEHVTMAGGDTINALQFGHQYIEITREFAQFIMDSISKA